MNNGERYDRIQDALKDRDLDIDDFIARIREIVGTESKGRRIVQIAAVGHENDQMWQGRTELFALCDDSTAWYQVHGEAFWVPIPDIPQDAPAESPDPIGELEAMGGRLFASVTRVLPYWSLGEKFEDVPTPTGGSQISDLRAAAARLLERVRGSK